MNLERYNFKVIEEKWQSYWLENKTFKAEIIEREQQSRYSRQKSKKDI